MTLPPMVFQAVALGDIHRLVRINQMLHHTRVSQCGNIPQALIFSRGNLAQDPPHDLARAGFRQPRRPLDDIRRGNRADLPAHPVFQFQAQLLVRLFTVFQGDIDINTLSLDCLLYTSPSPRDS